MQPREAVRQAGRPLTFTPCCRSVRPQASTGVARGRRIGVRCGRSSYDRLLRYAWLPDGRLVEEELLRDGFAMVVTYPPDVKYLDNRLLPAQEEARTARRGLWAEVEPVTVVGRVEPPACYVPGRNTCNCGDFATHADAQAFHETFDPGDINRLDGDGNGIVCESLP